MTVLTCRYVMITIITHYYVMISRVRLCNFGIYKVDGYEQLYQLLL